VVNPKELADPKSRLAMAAKARIAQLYGPDIENEKYVTHDPGKMFPYHLPGVLDRIPSLQATFLARLADLGEGQMPPINPFNFVNGQAAQSEHDKRRAAVDWYNSK
jgi:hypothetical protein